MPISRGPGIAVTPGISFAGIGGAGIVASPVPWAFPEVFDYYDARYGITEDVGVAAWAPVLKGTHTLVQAADAAQPAWTDGNSVLFDGSDDFLQALFAQAQPTTIVMAFKQITWTSPDYMLDGGSLNAMVFQQFSASGSPYIRIYAGSAGPETDELALDTYGIVSTTFNGAASAIQVNLGTPVTGDAGVATTSGLTVGASASGANPVHMQVKALARCGSISAARINELIRAMNAQYGVF